MFILENAALQVEVIHPGEEPSLLGSRYCSGGQIFQVIDREKGALFSGPTYPESYNTFDAQGLPDAFNSYPGLAQAACGDLIVAPGVGLVRYTTAIDHSFARENTEVVRPLPWSMVPSAASIEFSAREDYGACAYDLDRRIELIGRCVRVSNHMKNTGDMDVPISWFAHPFFPHTQDFVIGNFPSDLALNEFYTLNGDELRLNMPEGEGADFDKAFVSGTPHSSQGNLVIPVNHDLLGRVEVECEFPVDRLPIWYNRHTFSPEPFFVCALSPGESASWAIRYRL